MMITGIGRICNKIGYQLNYITAAYENGLANDILFRNDGIYTIDERDLSTLQQRIRDNQIKVKGHISDPNLLRLSDVIRKLNLPKEKTIEIVQLIKTESFDLKPVVTCPGVVTSGDTYFFGRTEVDEYLKNHRFKTPSQFSRDMGFSVGAVYKSLSTGRIVRRFDGKIDMQNFDLQKYKDEIYKSLDNKGQTSFGYTNPLDILNSFWQQLVKQYFKIRERGAEIGNDEKYGRLTKRGIKRQMMALSRILLSINCRAAGIPSPFNDQRNVRRMTLEEIDALMSCSCEIEDITPEAISDLIDGLEPSMAFAYKLVFKPFLIWYLDDWFDQIDEDDEIELKRHRSATKQIKRVLKQFPRRSEEPTSDRKRKGKWYTGKRSKVYLTRREAILVYDHLVRNRIQGAPDWHRFRNALIWMTCVLTQLRPEEVGRVEINDLFPLGEDGFLKPNEFGYCELRLPAWKSKGEYSPSHHEINLPVPPRLVTALNIYLQILYEKYPEKGKGLLFPVRLDRPDKGISRTFNFVGRYRHTFYFLPEEKRDSLDLKATRRSANNWIRKYKPVSDDLTLWHVIRAAQIQLRHDIRKSAGRDVGEAHYTEELAKDEHYRIVDAVLNFPWDLEELEEWENSKNQTNDLSLDSFSIYNPKDVQINNTHVDLNDDSTTNINAKLKMEYDDLISLNKLSHRKREEEFKNRGITFAEWNLRLSELQRVLKNAQ